MLQTMVLLLWELYFIYSLAASGHSYNLFVNGILTTKIIRTAGENMNSRNYVNALNEGDEMMVKTDAICTKCEVRNLITAVAKCKNCSNFIHL